MAPSIIPSQLVAFLAQSTTSDQAADALEEWIQYRRAKRDTLFEVSVGLAELEDRTPPNLSAAFDRARYLTNVPQPSDLTPPTGPFPLARSQSPATILNHLLSQPTPSLEHSREVILEYVLGREGKLREKKPGRGGKGTLGRDGFEDIAKRLGEVEDGLRGGSPSSPRTAMIARTTGRNMTTEGPDEPQQIGLTLVLSLRMSLSYFALQELADQLLLMAIGDAERILVQHIRRRMPGEGRWGIGKELEYVESLTSSQRPALRPAFRSAKVRTQLPPKAIYPIALPAPSKSVCIKLIASVAKDIESNGSALAAMSETSVPFPTQSGFSPGTERSYFIRRGPVSPGANHSLGASPRTRSSLTPPPLTSPTAITLDVASNFKRLAEYALELVSEFLTREKREHMLKDKWAKSGRDQLSRDLGEIESSLCLGGRNSASSHATHLLPVFLLLRRNYALPPSTLPPSVTDPYLDILPTPPDPDDVPFREPTVQSTTATLYVNPRLDDAAASNVLEELTEHEIEQVEVAGGTREQAVEWTSQLVESVEKRFPDGSYASVFALAKELIRNPPIRHSDPSSPFAPSDSIADKDSLRRRVQSTAAPQTAKPQPPALFVPSKGAPRQEHKRSISMPSRRSTYDGSDSDSSENGLTTGSIQPSPAPLSFKPQLTLLDVHAPNEVKMETPPPDFTDCGGWWDVVSAIENSVPAPWHENPRATSRKRTSSRAAPPTLALPPGAEPAQLLDFNSTYEQISKLDRNPSTPPRRCPIRSSPAGAQEVDLSLNYDSPRGGDSESDWQASSLLVSHEDSYFPSRRQPTPPALLGHFSRPSLPVTRDSDAPKHAHGQVPPITPPAANPTVAGGKSKLGGFGRSMSIAISRSKKEERDRDKENERGKAAGGSGKKVMNSPRKWNRDMVANIMGPPTERK